MKKNILFLMVLSLTHFSAQAWEWKDVPSSVGNQIKNYMHIIVPGLAVCAVAKVVYTFAQYNYVKNVNEQRRLVRQQELRAYAALQNSAANSQLAMKFDAQVACRNAQLCNKNQLKNNLHVLVNKTDAIIESWQRGFINRDNIQDFNAAVHDSDRAINQLAKKRDERCYMSGEVLSTEFSNQKDIERFDALIDRNKKFIDAYVLPDIKQKLHEIDADQKIIKQKKDQYYGSLQVIKESKKINASPVLSESPDSDDDAFEDFK